MVEKVEELKEDLLNSPEQVLEKKLNSAVQSPIQKESSKSINEFSSSKSDEKLVTAEHFLQEHPSLNDSFEPIPAVKNYSETNRLKV